MLVIVACKLGSSRETSTYLSLVRTAMFPSAPKMRSGWEEPMELRESRLPRVSSRPRKRCAVGLYGSRGMGL